MIAEIGVMIAAYIITRMVELLGKPASRVAKVLGVVTVVVAALIAADLIVGRPMVPPVMH
jgi:hypothetical protein